MSFSGNSVKENIERQNVKPSRQRRRESVFRDVANKFLRRGVGGTRASKSSALATLSSNCRWTNPVLTTPSKFRIDLLPIAILTNLFLGFSYDLIEISNNEARMFSHSAIVLSSSHWCFSFFVFCDWLPVPSLPQLNVLKWSLTRRVGSPSAERLRNAYMLEKENVRPKSPILIQQGARSILQQKMAIRNASQKVARKLRKLPSRSEGSSYFSVTSKIQKAERSKTVSLSEHLAQPGKQISPLPRAHPSFAMRCNVATPVHQLFQ